MSSEVAGTGTNWLETRSGGGELQRRENLLYVGIDLHKETHTAVMVNCWNEKLEVVVIENKPITWTVLFPGGNHGVQTKERSAQSSGIL